MNTIKLGTICDVVAGGTPSRSKPEYWQKGTIPWIKIGNIKGKYIKNADEFITNEGLKNSSAKMLSKGTILYTIFATLGEVGILDFDACTNQAIAGITIKEPSLISENYLYYYLRSKKNYINSIGRGVAQNNINLSILRNFDIPLPEIKKQQEIINTLDNIATIIALRKKQIQKLDDLIKARFVEMFGEPKLNPNGYPVHQLSKYIEFLTSGSRGWAQYCREDGAEWFITIKNVKDCRISIDNMQPINAPDNAEAKRTRVQEGDLLISITADLGRTGVVTKEIAEHGAYINQHLTCIRLNRELLEPLYVAYFMDGPAGKEQFISKNQSGVKAGLNFNSINTLQILIPPKATQQEFLAFVAQVNKSKITIQKALDEVHVLFDSLMQQYFG